MSETEITNQILNCASELQFERMGDGSTLSHHRTPALCIKLDKYKAAVLTAAGFTKSGQQIRKKDK